MRKLALLTGVLALLMSSCAGKDPGGGHQGQELVATETHADHYYCPMHPDYRSEGPGNCPICTMKMVKMEPAVSGARQPPDEAPATPGMAMRAEATSRPENAIFIAPQRRQLIGVQSVPAEIRPLAKEIRAVGRVAYDETRLTHIHTKVTGYIEEVFVDFVGKAVERGDPLFTIYSPDLVATQEEYLLALRASKSFQSKAASEAAEGAAALLEAARRRLSLWDISDGEIQALGREGQVKRALTSYSPVSGIVIERAAYHHGRYVDPAMDLYLIADLSEVWVLADIYEYELPYVKTGQVAQIEFPYDPEARTLWGKVAFVYPYLNPRTRTAQVRMEFANPGFALKPDMFVNVRLAIDLGERLAAPEDAVLNTGTEQYVFVDLGDGYFEPRAVKVGAEAGGYLAVESGLEPGERVVTAANFILDSESRLKGAFANMGKPQAGETEMPVARVEKLALEVLEPRVAKVGANTLRLAITDPSGNPVTDAEVEVALFMPQMGNMPPMTAKANLHHVHGGEYTGQIDIPMAWTWQTTVAVKKAGQTLGSAETTITAR